MASIEQLYSALATASSDQQNATQPALVVHAGQIAVDTPAVASDMSNADLQNWFLDAPDVEAVAVVKNGAPVALVNRNVFMEQYGRPFSREVFGKRSCLSFANQEPLMVGADTPIEVVVRNAVEPESRVMKDGFICTRDGQYFGIGSGMALIRAMSDIEAAKTRQLLSSIEYASAIQQSNLRHSQTELAACLPSARLEWLPRDVVGGDCYFFRATRNGMFGALIDCTGHGVPGAFMTLITLSFLENRVATGCDEPDPAQVLSELNRYIKKVLGQHATGGEAHVVREGKSDDGLDAFMFVLTGNGLDLQYASARLELAVLDEQQPDVLLLEGDRMGVGYSDTPDDFAFTTRRHTLQTGYRAFVTTDGIIDQVGGPKQIAHGRKRLYKLFADHRDERPQQFGDTLLASFAEWQGQQHRRDDVCFFAFTNEA
ncbi:MULTISPECIES: SpoIIE family protein phosphatase [Paraburkholderia]|uniref:SpoIIE family protein phosphatase n=1 Tax=Paraburkholderia TaxID=1822464 RepID=UPI002257BDB0|nr:MULTISPECIES: SpoIIE family protein phosphatase [Paraburkholderia]MCX4162707.1 SpoIIE family protein phosphatase [Paraburkholderia megapolitana]MDN7158202.1 SpoIIE family protein phosphatase [Paraburkholderia sp. CHISQ3]MDQ6495249.1 SpoIIE family protein phosphatase [Paraburkholderia megapolitana]